MILNQSVACKRLRAVGLTQRQTLQILDQIHLWVSSSGEEWTIKRLKSLKVAYIRKLAGSPYAFKFSPWINKTGDVPKGPFKVLFQMKKVQKALSALMVYTSYISKETTKSQISKFVTAVTSTGVDVPRKITSDIKESTDKLISEIFPFTLDELRNKRHSHPSVFADRQVRIPCVRTVVSHDSSKEEWRSGMEFIDSIKTTNNNSEDFLASFSYPPVEDYFNNLKQLPDGLEETLMASAFIGDNFSNIDTEELSAGRIGFIQEPGYKLRTVANPHPSIQVALSRLGNKVYDLLKHVDTDCTFNQDSAVEDVQVFLNSELNTKGLMSIDLSSATDRFPLDLQLSVLNQLKDNGILEGEDIDLFSKISRSKFTMPDGSTIQWKTGQPLGVYPSFGVFALTHNMLAQTVDPTFFRILGDDIVIDFEAGKRLRKLYADLGLVISEDKSIASKTLAEFGGRLISNDRSYVQPKWRDISDRSFIELAKNLGPKSMGLFKPRQQKILKVLSDVHPDVHTWGLNWNTRNLSYNERIALSNDVMQLFLDEEKDLLNLREDQIELRDLKWGIIVKEFFDYPLLIEREEHTSDKPDVVLFKALSKSKGTLIKKGHSKLSMLSSDFLDQINLTCSDIILSSANIGNVSIEDGHKKPPGFNIKSGVTSGDPRGETTLDVAERKLKLKPKPPGR